MKKTAGRKSAEEKAETHELILRKAAQAFRQHGTELGVLPLMKELGLTHGGFYRHFSSKEELMDEAIARSLDEMSMHLEAMAAKATQAGAVAAMVNFYVSRDHVQHPEMGCPIAALGSELGRLDVKDDSIVYAAMRRYQDRLYRFRPGRSESEKRQNFTALLSAMAGTVTVARLMPPGKEVDTLLESSRKRFAEQFAPTQK